MHSKVEAEMGVANDEVGVAKGVAKDVVGVAKNEVGVSVVMVECLGGCD